MGYIKFKNKEDAMQAAVLPVSPHKVRLTCDAEPNTAGFRLYLDAECNHPLDAGEYEAYTTLYRKGEGWFELSNDNSVYGENVPQPPYELTEEEKEEAERWQKISALQMQIKKFKEQIEATDYQVIKTYEYSLIGLKTEYDMETLHRQRQALRDQINALEEALLTTE